MADLATETPLTFNALYQWLHVADPDTTVIGGSATPALSIEELIQLSTDADATRAALDLTRINFNLGAEQGDANLRTIVTGLFDSDRAQLTSKHIIIANGTTGCNHIVHQSLLTAGDHVICQYPIYGPCIEEPKYIGCDISFLQLNANDNWNLDLQALHNLIRPGKTKLLVLNNPVNPTGTHFDSSLQREILQLCKEHNITLHCDEIFRPFFHIDQPTTSFIEHYDLEYDNVVVTSSLSKTYGGSGIRIGWVATRSEHLLAKFKMYRLLSCMAVSTIDEAIAAEMLSPRCRGPILDKHLDIARTNIMAIQELIDMYPGLCDWVRPTAGSVGFIRFKDSKTGEPVDDTAFCKRLVDKKKVLLAPASLCFEFDQARDAFKGRVRIHFTCPPAYLRKGLDLLRQFLEEYGTKSYD